MAIPNPTVKFTYEDYLNAPEDKRYELLDGELVPIPTPGERHQSISILLGSKLVQFAYENSLGRVYHAPFDVVLSDVDVIQPDLLFVSNERCHIITPANIQGAPDLVVEILSLSTAERDKTFKRALYANHGVNEILDGGPHRKRHNSPVARRARIRGRGYLRRRSDLDFADLARLQGAYRRPILRGLQCQGLAASKGHIGSSFIALTVMNLGMCMSEEKKEHASTGLNPLHCAKITGSLPMNSMKFGG